jgi:hypothetical protein
LHLEESQAMSDESQTSWVELKLEFPDEVGTRLEKVARDAGLSLQCYCVRVLLRHLLKDASPEQKERWQKQLPATLRRNGCDDSAEL